jgi:hypothetical protein
MRRRLLAFAMIALLLGGVPRAHALFHLAVIDEVMTSYGGDPAAQFVEIEMLAGSQNLVHHSILAAFDASGAYVGDILEVPANVANSGSGVRWLAGTSAFQTASGLAPDFVMPSGILPSGGGMVCFGGGGGILPANPPTWSRTTFTNYVDCVAYGSYSGPSNLHVGTPTSIAPDGHSIVRVSETDDNAADFACGDPASPTTNAPASASLTATTACPAPPAAEIGVPAVKLIALDNLSNAGKAKVVYVAKDGAVTKGVGTDPGGIGVEFTVRYASDSASGSFLVPVGDAGWLVNKTSVAKFVNKSAPAGSTEAKVAVIKPGTLVKLVGKGLGDVAFDILGGGDPAGAVRTAYCVTNGGAEYCHCSTFSGCAYKLIAGNTGAKLVCKSGTADAACTALGP